MKFGLLTPPTLFVGLNDQNDLQPSDPPFFLLALMSIERASLKIFDLKHPTILKWLCSFC